MTRKIRAFTALGFAVLATASLHAATVALEPAQSSILIHGSSNIVGFTCHAQLLEGQLQVDGSSGRPDAYVRAAVKDIDCGPKARSRHFREAIDAAHYPVAEFRLVNVNRDSTPPLIEGTLSVAGHEKRIVVPTELAVAANGSIRASGSFPLRMSDFGVAPPRRMGGLLRVHDAVTVSFDLQFAITE